MELICPRCRQVFLPDSLFSALASEAKREGGMRMPAAVSITTTCPYCHLGPIHSQESVEVCSNCGGICLKEARFCPRCGVSTTRPSRRPVQTARRGRRLR